MSLYDLSWIGVLLSFPALFFGAAAQDLKSDKLMLVSLGLVFIVVCSLVYICGICKGIAACPSL